MNTVDIAALSGSMQRSFTSAELRVAANQAVTLAFAATNADVRESFLAAAGRLMKEAEAQDGPDCLNSGAGPALLLDVANKRYQRG